MVDVVIGSRGAGDISVEQPTADITGGTTIQAAVTRTAGDGAVSVDYAVSGLVTDSGVLIWADGVGSSQDIEITVPDTNGSVTLTLSNPQRTDGTYRSLPVIQNEATNYTVASTSSSAFFEIPYLAETREFLVTGITSVYAAANSNTSDSNQTATGTIWANTSALQRLAARGYPSVGSGPQYYVFGGNRAGYEYETEHETSTSYIVGECVYVGNNFFMCTTAGTTSPSAPSFVTTTEESSTTSDGTVVWTYIGNVVNDHSGNFTNWEDTGDLSLDILQGRAGGNFDSFFYDTASTALQARKDSISQGYGTQADQDLLDWIAGCMIQHDRVRNASPAYRNTSGSNIPGAPQPQIHTISAGWIEDNLASGTRYKGRGLTTPTDLQGIAVTGNYSGSNSGNADLSTITTYSPTEGTYTSPTSVGGVRQESSIREVSYAFRNWIHFKRAEWEDTATLAWPDITISGDITFGVPLPRFYIACLFEYFHKAMNGLRDEATGWAPFMKGNAFHTLREYYDLMKDAGLDPDTHVSDADMGGDYNGWSWSDSVSHGISQSWPTIGACTQDFLYWMRYTAQHEISNAVGDDMFYDTANGWWQRSNQAKVYTGGNANINPDLNGLIAPAYYFAARCLHDGDSDITALSKDQWVDLADSLWTTAVESYSWFGTGKQLNEVYGYYHKAKADRNYITGRND